jgi:lysozyme
MDVRELIKKHEGLRLAPYRCSAGHWTGGYGHNFDSHGEIPHVLSQEEAEACLDADLSNATAAAMSLIENWEALGEVRQAVLIDMAFNMGKAGLSKFVNTLAYINEGNFELASLGMAMSKWAQQVGHRAAEDCFMMQKGDWPA